MTHPRVADMRAGERGESSGHGGEVIPAILGGRQPVSTPEHPAEVRWVRKASPGRHGADRYGTKSRIGQIPAAAFKAPPADPCRHRRILSLEQPVQITH